MSNIDVLFATKDKNYHIFAVFTEDGCITNYILTYNNVYADCVSLGQLVSFVESSEYKYLLDQILESYLHFVKTFDNDD